MKRAAIMAVLVLTGCVAADPTAQAITIDGVAMSVRQVKRGMTYGYMSDNAGNYSVQEAGLGQFIAVAGAPDRDAAIRALGAYCGRVIDPDAFDNEQVPVAPDTGEYQFGGTCG